MKGVNHIPSVLVSIVIAWVPALAFVAVGCEREEKKPQAQAAAERPKVVNDRCPIMGTTMDPANVPDSLVRTYKGRKIGFCCGGCPVAWDKLSDAEKDDKLTKVMPPKE